MGQIRRWSFVVTGVWLLMTMGCYVAEVVVFRVATPHPLPTAVVADHRAFPR